MANPEKGEQRIEIGGKEYTLRLTTNATCQMEARSEQTATQLLIASLRDGSVTAARWLLWASLQNYHGAQFKTPDDVGPLIDEAGGLEGVNAQLDALSKLNEAPAALADTNGKGELDRPLDAQPATIGDASVSMPA